MIKMRRTTNQRPRRVVKESKIVNTENAWDAYDAIVNELGFEETLRSVIKYFGTWKMSECYESIINDWDIPFNGDEFTESRHPVRRKRIR